VNKSSHEEQLEAAHGARIEAIERRFSAVFARLEAQKESEIASLTRTYRQRLKSVLGAMGGSPPDEEQVQTR